jgi:hypothetical protein
MAVSRPYYVRLKPLTAHHIDNLDAAIPSDTVDSEVNGDSYSFFAHDLAG